MPNITFLESGTDATGNFSFFTSTTGTVASDATTSKTGLRSIKLSTGSPAVTAGAIAQNTCADAGRRVSVWFKFDTAPAVQTPLFAIQTNGGLGVIAVDLSTTRKLISRPLGATQVTGTTVLSVDTWYRITLSYTVTNTTTFRADVFLNGTPEASATAGTLTRTGSNQLTLQANSGFGANCNVWFDNIYIDDGSDYSDPGDIRVTAKRPASNNTNNFDTAIGANPANRWTNVNEVPLSTTNGWRHNATTDVQENYTLETAAVGDVNIAAYPRIGTTAWIWANGAAGGAGTPKIMANGSETAITLTNAGKLFTVLTTTTAYPNNAAGIGMRSTNNADDTFLYECGTLIAYTNLDAISGSVASVTSSSTTPKLALKGSGSCASASSIGTVTPRIALKTSASCDSVSSSTGSNKVGLKISGDCASPASISASQSLALRITGECAPAASSSSTPQIGLRHSNSCDSSSSSSATPRIAFNASASCASDVSASGFPRIALGINGDCTPSASSSGSNSLGARISGDCNPESSSTATTTISLAIIGGLESAVTVDGTWTTALSVSGECSATVSVSLELEPGEPEPPAHEFTLGILIPRPSTARPDGIYIIAEFGNATASVPVDVSSGRVSIGYGVRSATASAGVGITSRRIQQPALTVGRSRVKAIRNPSDQELMAIIDAMTN